MKLLRFAMQSFPLIWHLHERGVGPNFIASLMAHSDVVFASGPLHVIPYRTEMRHPNIHGIV